MITHTLYIFISCIYTNNSCGFSSIYLLAYLFTACNLIEKIILRNFFNRQSKKIDLNYIYIIYIIHILNIFSSTFSFYLFCFIFY